MNRVHGRHGDQLHPDVQLHRPPPAVATAQPVAKLRRQPHQVVQRGPLVIPRRHVLGPLLAFVALALVLHAWGAALPLVVLAVVVWRYRRV